ncbi:MAG: cysteine synthase [Akkermansiaceae bacterium]
MPGGCVDAIVSGVGTGGTLRGLYEAFDAAGCHVTAHVAIPRHAQVVTVFPDRMERYFSHKVFDGFRA